jgi:hypothetical protein
VFENRVLRRIFGPSWNPRRDLNPALVKILVEIDTPTLTSWVIQTGIEQASVAVRNVPLIVTCILSFLESPNSTCK